VTALHQASIPSGLPVVKCLGLAVSLLAHGPLIFLAAMVFCGAAFIAWLLCRRRAVAGTPQSSTMAWVGLLLGLLGLALGFAGLVGHPLFGLGWSWQIH
jgi:hypothetical protein